MCESYFQIENNLLYSIEILLSIFLLRESLINVYNALPISVYFFIVIEFQIKIFPFIFIEVGTINSLLPD